MCVCVAIEGGFFKTFGMILVVLLQAVPEIITTTVCFEKQKGGN